MEKKMPQQEVKKFLEELKSAYEIAYEDGDILEIEKEVICDMCDGLGCKWCNNTGAIEIIVTYDKKTGEEVSVTEID